jgi:hypothetical protein
MKHAKSSYGCRPSKHVRADGVCRPIWVSGRRPPSLRTCSIAPSRRLLPIARAKRSLGRSITTRATCPAKRIGKDESEQPNADRKQRINKMKSAEFARADAGGIFERKASCPERSGSIHHLGAA